jgi:chromosome segregation ATPase
MDSELEQCYKNKISKLEQEIRSLKSEYESAHKVEEHMAEQISAQKRIIENRNEVIKKYVDKYGLIKKD